MISTIRKDQYLQLLFQVVLHAVVFVFYAHSRRSPGIEVHQIFFFLNYAVAAAVVNYVLLPRFLYTHKNVHFVAYLCLLVGLVILVEEGVLEQIFFPDTRGMGFPGVFSNLLSAMPTITILSGFKFAWDALQKQREVRQLKDSVKESELQFLKSQINPHFLFNNMNNLYAHAMEQSPKTPEIILELSAVLRYMLYDCNVDFVPLSKEVEQMKNYISLSELQIEGRGQVSFKHKEVSSNLKIAPLILVVFIENAFKHSASSQTENIDIEVSLNVTDAGILNFHCSNSYQEESNTNSLDRGIGLENVKKRLQLIYPKCHGLNIKAESNRYIVDLTINLNRA